MQSKQADKLKRHDRDTGTSPVTITVPTDVLDQLDALADLQGKTRSLLISDMLRTSLKKR